MLFLIAVLLAIFVLPAPWGLVAVAVAATIEVTETLVFLWWSRRKGATVGVESLVGKKGIVVTGLWPEGQVRVSGELWRARYRGGCEVGAAVIVRAVDGLVLEVEPA